MLYCVKCGSPYKDGDKFCEGCGTVLKFSSIKTKQKSRWIYLILSVIFLIVLISLAKHASVRKEKALYGKRQQLRKYAPTIISISSDDGSFFDLNRQGDILARAPSPNFRLTIVRGIALKSSDLDKVGNIEYIDEKQKAEQEKIKAAIEIIDNIKLLNLKHFFILREIIFLNLEDVTLLTEEQFKIKFNNRDIQKKSKDLKAILRELKRQGKPLSSIEYVDLRFSEPVIKFNNK